MLPSRSKLMQQPEWLKDQEMADLVASDSFGNVKGYEVGHKFADRRTCCAAGVHRHTQAGIVGTREKGCPSIVVSGQYEDDKDHGDVIYYTGAGGRDEQTGRQVEDQDMTRRENAALKRSQETRRPIRVVRSLGPGKGYRYDGLYRVAEAKEDKGKGGFKICRFTLVRLPNQPPLPQ
ncbi:PUA-like domain-containing protein [Schizophyllum fasciatum]